MTLAPPDSLATSRGPLGEALSVVVLRPTGNGRQAQGEAPEPPLAALTLAARVRSLPAWRRAALDSGDERLQVLDAALEGWNLDQTCENLVSSAPEVCLVHGEGASPAHLEVLFQALADRLPEVVAVLVAGHASHVDQAPLDLVGLRFVVHGDPQRPLAALLAGLALGRRCFDDVPGLDWRNAEGQLVRQEALPPGHYLPPSPLPAWDLVDRERYAAGRLTRGKTSWASLLTSRACPAGCPACRNAYGRVFRVRELTEVLAELRLLVSDLRVHTIRLADELFNHDLPRAKAFLRGFLREAPDVRLELPNGLRPDRVDAELAGLLRRCGVQRCTVTVDSASPSMQRALRHNLDLAEAARGVEHLVRAGLWVHGRFSLGWPDETPLERQATARFARTGAFHSASFRAATSDNSAGIPVALSGLGKTHRAARWAGLAFCVHPTRLASGLRWMIGALRSRLQRWKPDSLPA